MTRKQRKKKGLKEKKRLCLAPFRALAKVKDAARRLQGMRFIGWDLGHDGAGVVTGRLSGSQPAIQNLPRSIQGRLELVQADYSEIEQHVLTMVEQVRNAVAIPETILSEETSDAVRRLTQTAKDRAMEKAMLFGSRYGMSPAKIARTLTGK